MKRRGLDSTDPHGLQTSAWPARVRAALDDDLFVVYSQPIVDALTRSPVQEELLIRMRDVDGSLISPGEFLPAAEKYGFIYDIDVWMIGQAARLAAAGRFVEVNISGPAMIRPGLLGAIRAAVDEQGCDPQLLCLEITETALVSDVAQATAFAAGLHELGCKLAIDDFDTGYGTLTHIKQLPIAYIKIDTEFVGELVGDFRNRSVVQALVSLAQGGGQKTIAEGVEDERTLKLLQGLGVDLVQGYLIGRPQPLAHVPS